jgi:hypothetical protein
MVIGRVKPEGSTASLLGDSESRLTQVHRPFASSSFQSLS